MIKLNVTEALKTAETDFLERQKQWHGTQAFRPAIKYFKRLNVFKASNVSFDPTTFEAHSYRWWLFVKVIGNQVVFNDFSYSPSTSGHQSSVRSLLGQLGIKIDVTIKAPRGLQDLGSAISHYKGQIEGLREAMANPRSRGGKNLERARDIKALEAKIKVVQALIKEENYHNRKAA